MKKYIVGVAFALILGGIVLLAPSVSAACPSGYVAAGTQCCELGVTPANCYDSSKKTAKQELEACQGKGADNADVTDTAKGSCAKAYSCETLFTTTEVARTCNYNRCIAQRGAGADYCICKYGEGGNGLNVGIPLNTTMPFIGRCLKKSDGSTSDTAALDAFPTIVGVASRILVTVIMLVSFIMIIVGGVQRASGDAKAGKAKITKVAKGFALLGMMGAILRLINPNFFK